MTATQKHQPLDEQNIKQIRQMMDSTNEKVSRSAQEIMLIDIISRLSR